MRLWLLALLVPFLIAPSFSNSGGGLGRLILYGDSNTDEGYASCDWCRFGDYFSSYVIVNASDGGAWSSYALRSGDDCVSGDSYTGCEDYGEYQVDHFEGACRVGTTNSPKDPYAGNGVNALTCLEDVPGVDSRDVVVIWFGTNDTGRNPAASFDSLYLPGIKTAWQTMVSAVNDAGTGCVITTGFPHWGGAGVGFETIYEDRNTNREKINGYLDGTLTPSLASDLGAAYPDCVVVDIYSAVLAFESEYGTRPMLDLYERCFDKLVTHNTVIAIDDPYWVERMGPGVDPGGVIWDCAHMGNAGDSFVSRIMENAIKEARRRVLEGS